MRQRQPSARLPKLPTAARWERAWQRHWRNDEFIRMARAVGAELARDETGFAHVTDSPRAAVERIVSGRPEAVRRRLQRAAQREASGAR